MRLSAAILMLLAVATAAMAEPVKIVAWNLEWFPGRRPEPRPEEAVRHMKQVQAALRRMQPDILILTEVRDADVVKEAVSVLPGFTVHVASDFQLRHQQIAIASRYPSRAAWAQRWLQPIYGPPRGFSFASLDLPGGAHVLVFGVHLKSNRGVDVMNRCMREASALQLIAYANFAKQRLGAERTGVLLAGDFNTNLDSPKFKRDATCNLFRYSGFWWPFETLPPEQRITWHGRDYDPVQFDHFFSWNLGRSAARPLGYDTVSDHHPIVMIVDTDDIK